MFTLGATAQYLYFRDDQARVKGRTKTYHPFFCLEVVLPWPFRIFPRRELPASPKQPSIFRSQALPASAVP